MVQFGKAQKCLPGRNLTGRSGFLEVGLFQSPQGKAIETELSVGVGGWGGHSEVMNPLSSRGSVASGHEFPTSVPFSAQMIHKKKTDLR